MRRLFLLPGTLAALVVAGCLNDSGSKHGKAEVRVRLEKIGAMQKGAAANAIEMQNLVLVLRLAGALTRRDTIPLSGNGQKTVMMTYENLSSLRTWSLEGTARGCKGITIYRDSVKFTVPAEGTAEIALNLRPIYSMLTARFFPIRDSVTRCELWVDGALIADSSFPVQSLVGDTVKLTRDYVLADSAGRETVIRMDVYGDWFGQKNLLLYRGEASIKVYSSRDTSYDISLFRVGPPAPIGQGKINVTLGAVRNANVNGYLDPAFWQFMGVTGAYEFLAEGANRFAMALSPSGTPHLALRDLDHGGKLSVKRWAGSDWEKIGASGFSAGPVSHLSLAFSPEGVPHAAFRDMDLGGKASVVRWNGSAWENLGSPGFSPGEVSSVSLGISESGQPHVAFRDGGNGGKASVMRWNGTAWENLGSPGFSPGEVQSVALKLSGNVSYVAFRDGANGGKASVMRWNGTAWENLGSPGFSSGAIGEIALALSAAGIPHVAFNAEDEGLKARVMKWSGTSWEAVGSSNATPGTAIYLSLALRGETPYLAFSDYTRTYRGAVARWNGIRWENVGPASITDAESGFHFLGFAGDIPYLAFEDHSRQGRISLMRFDVESGAGLAKIAGR